MRYISNLLLIIIASLFICSCSKENDVDIETDKKAETKLKVSLKVKEKKKNIFQLMEFSILPDDDFSFNELKANFDSVLWKVSDYDGYFKVIESGKTIYNWSHNFFTPGIFDTYLIGYKEGKAFSSDTISLNIENQRDFLGYNWSDIKGSLNKGQGYVNVLPNNYPFSTYQDKHQNTPCVKFYLSDDTETNESILLDYIKSVYHDPVCNQENGDRIMKKYYDMFNYKKDNASPTNIWITPTSRIVLLKCYDGDYSYYEVYAEPHNY